MSQAFVGTDTSMTRIIAHRGYAGVAPENTVSSVHFAADRGADLVEVDTMPSADGRAVVFHDSRLDDQEGNRGVTDRTGVVWETPFAELVEAQVLDSGEHIPALSEVVRTLPDGVGLNIELKHCGAPTIITGRVLTSHERDERMAQWEPFVRTVLDVLDEFSGEVLFSSFAEGALAALRAQAPDAQLAPIVADRLDVAFELADRYEATAVHPSMDAFGVTLPEPVDPIPVQRAHDAGYAVNVWTIETWYQAAQLRGIGVDGLITEYPGLTTW